MELATNFTYCVFDCFLESADLKPSIFVWNLQESPASSGQYILTTNNSIMVTCSNTLTYVYYLYVNRNSSDPQTVSTWASQSYSDASLIDDVCDPQTTFRGLKKRGVHVQFECAANGKACNSGDLCAATIGKMSPYQGPNINTAAITGGAAGATALASALAGLVYYLRKLKMRKIRDSTPTSPQGSTADLVPDVPHVFFEPAQTSQFPTRTH
ncbi:hypothetical protein FSP39_022262 [Pinctada imbricata]|uniref:Uncharacterized protein n=1 Tax=Pinctada imbricata TaxID=66713 RepID=A0AA89BY02_PINIB|nr:hypothetical protein FSP39_022262 [Pinctada imbricata]